MPVPTGDRGSTTGPPPATSGVKSEKSAPHRPPEHWPSFAHAWPGVPPPTHVDGHAPPEGQSPSTTQLFAAFEQVPACRAMRRIVYGASAEPKSVTTSWPATLGSAVGSKIGGSRAPSGVYEPRNTGSGIEKPSGERSVARMSRGTGMPESFTRMPDQSNGTSR